MCYAVCGCTQEPLQGRQHDRDRSNERDSEGQARSSCEKTRRTQSFLAERAIARYVDRELEMMEAVEQGLEDFRTGNVVSHEEAMRQIKETIAKYER